MNQPPEYPQHKTFDQTLWVRKQRGTEIHFRSVETLQYAVQGHSGQLLSLAGRMAMLEQQIERVSRQLAALMTQGPVDIRSQLEHTINHG